MIRPADHPKAKLIYGLLAVACAVLAWAVVLRAIDTGKLLLYGLFFVLLGLGVHWTVKIFRH